MALKLLYEDIAVGADDVATATATDKEAFSDLSRVPYGVEPPAIATVEPNGWGLTRDYEVRDDQPCAYWSNSISGADCVFTSPPTLTVDFSTQQTSTGLTFRFSPVSAEYCCKLSVVWYQDGAVKDSGTYYPDRVEYSVENTVEAFDKIVITFKETSLPRRRVKLEHVMIGVVREISEDEITGAKFVHEVDLISDVVPINVLDANFQIKRSIDLVFQRTQPVEAYNGDTLIGVYYIEDGDRYGVRSYGLSCVDAIGVLDMSDYSANIWIEDTPLTTILADVLDGMFEVEIDPAYADSTLRGYIPDCTRREALQYVAFALGAVVDTSGTKKIKLYPMPTGTGAAIPASKTYIGGKVKVAVPVTEVTVTAYVFFDERPGENQDSVVVNGVEYRYYTDTKHAYNPDTVGTNLPKKLKFDKSYLVNLSNAQTLADNIMDYYTRQETYSVKHVLDGQSVGDRVSAYLPWGADARNGNITKMTVTYSGIAASDTEMLLE